MKSINEVMLTAGLTKDVEVRTYNGNDGKTFYNCQLSLAFTKSARTKDGGFEDVSMYINGSYITRSEKILPLLTKGTQLVVVGSLDQYMGKDNQQRYTCLNIRDVRIISQPRQASQNASQPNGRWNVESAGGDEYVPF